jgi:hypothetical protein
MEDFNKIYDFELLKATEEDGERYIYGVASTESVDCADEIVEATGIKKSAEWYLKHGIVDYDHQSQLKNDPKYIIGRPVKLDWDKDNRTHFKAKLHKGVEMADHIWKLAKAGDPLGFSVGGKVLERRKEYDPKLNKNVTKISKVFLNHIAVTPFPANGDTMLTTRPYADFLKSCTASSPMTDEDFALESTQASQKMYNLTKDMSAMGNESTEGSGGVEQGANPLSMQDLEAKPKKQRNLQEKQQEASNESADMSKKRKDLLSGGLADDTEYNDFDKDSLDKGTKVEREHTDNKKIAKEIAMDHLTEDPKYYDKLERMEKKRQVIILNKSVNIEVCDDKIIINTESGNSEVIQDKELIKKSGDEKSEIVMAYLELLKAFSDCSKEALDVNEFLIKRDVGRNSRRVVKRHLLKKVSEVMNEDFLMKYLRHPTFGGGSRETDHVNASSEAYRHNGTIYGAEEDMNFIPKQEASTPSEEIIANATGTRVKTDAEVDQYLLTECESAPMEELENMQRTLDEQDYEAMPDTIKFTRYNEIRSLYGRAPLSKEQLDKLNEVDSYSLIRVIKQFDRTLKVRIQAAQDSVRRILEHQSKIAFDNDNQDPMSVVHVRNV